MSSGEGILLAEVMNDFCRKIRELGPLGKGEGMDADGLKFKLEAVSQLVPYIKLVERERLRVPFKIGGGVPPVLRQRRGQPALRGVDRGQARHQPDHRCS